MAQSRIVHRRCVILGTSVDNQLTADAFNNEFFAESYLSSKSFKREVESLKVILGAFWVYSAIPHSR
jgi:hypothetical protein